MKKTNLSRFRELKSIEKELKDFEVHFRFKREFMIGVTSGIAVTILFQIQEYFAQKGIFGMIICVVLFITLYELFMRKDKKKISELEKRIQKVSS